MAGFCPSNQSCIPRVRLFVACDDFMGFARVCLVLVSMFLLAGQVIGPVAAQIITPAPLPDDEYQPLGISAGGLFMFPSVETGLRITDNVAQAPQGRRDDIGYFVAPSMRIESDWVRHSVSIDASSRHVFYFDNPSEDATNVDVRLRSRVDVRRSTDVQFSAGYNLEQEGRGSIDVPGAAAEPPNEHRFDGAATLTRRFNRLEASAGVSGEYNLFEDVDLVGGGSQNNSDRNYAEIEGQLRLGYNISPKVQPFVAASYSVRHHDQEFDDNGLARDSDGFAVQAGVRLEASAALSGEVAIGYVRREFDDAALSAIDGVTVDATVTWQPTTLTTIEFSASTNVNETSAGTLSGAIERSFAASLSHALRRNLTVAARAAFSIEDFTGGSLQEETLLVSAGLTYQFNRTLALMAGYTYEDFNSSTAGSDYFENRFVIGVLLQR